MPAHRAGIATRFMRLFWLIQPLHAAAMSCAVIFALAACGEKEAPPQQPQVPASRASQPMTGSPGGANAFNEHAPGSGETAVAHALPAVCEKYLAKIDACIAHLGATSDNGYQLKQAADQARKEWALMDDQASLHDMCEQAVAAFAQPASDVECS